MAATLTYITSAGVAEPARIPDAMGPVGRLRDKFGRAITDLRISITDRCNYRCVYCRTGNEGAQYADLRLDEYLRMVRVLVSLGIEKVRITGGEPLLRRGVVEFVSKLAALRTNPGQ